MRLVVPVEDVVLKDEEDVKENREESKTKLGGVAEYTAPVIVVVGDQNHLGEILKMKLVRMKLTWRMLRLPPVKSRRMLPMLQPTVLFRL